MAASIKTRQELANSQSQDDARLGEEIRKLRKARGKSLEELGEAIGRSISFLSQVERGGATASIADLKGIAQLLGVPLGWFFVNDRVPLNERGRIVRSSSRRQLGTVTSGFLEELLSPDIGGSFEMLLSRFEPGAALASPLLRDTEEEGYVVAGVLDVWMSKKKFRVTAGDSFRIVREPFRWANPGDQEAVVVWVIAPPSY